MNARPTSSERVASDSRRTPLSTHWGFYDVITQSGRIVDVKAIAEDPEPSPIGLGMGQTAYHPCRIRRPAARKSWLEKGPRKGGNPRGAEPFVEISWDEALDLAAAELSRVKRDHGNEAIFGGSYGWASAGRFHHAQSQIHRFLSMFGGYTKSINSYSFAAMEVILPHVIGGSKDSMLARSPLWEEIEAHGELVVAFGGIALRNRQVSNGGAGIHRSGEWMSRCRAAGIDFVNVSPLADDVDPSAASEWLGIRPNTDVAMMLGLAHTILVENRHDRDFLERCCVGFEQLEAYLRGKTDGIEKNAQWASHICDIPAAKIVDLARRITERRTLISMSWSVQRADHGEQPYWMAVALAAMSGSMGKPGGGFGTGYGCVNHVGEGRGRPSLAALPQPPNPVDIAIPVARISDALLAPGRTIDYNGKRVTFPDIRLVHWCGGNPFHHQQDINRLVKAWREPETIIVHDSWWTSTTRFADLVFPAATQFERNDFGVGANSSWLSYSAKAIDAVAEARTDYECFTALAERLGFGDLFSEGRSADDWVRHLYEETRRRLAESDVDLPEFDKFVRAGRVKLAARNAHVDGFFEDLRASPDTSPLTTPSGKIELFSNVIASFNYEDCPGHPSWLEPAEWLGSPKARQFGLHLITNQPATRLHSQFDHGDYSQESKVQGREPVRINPLDAEERDIKEGDVVKVYNERGACLAGAVLSASVRRGVVQMATGAWYDPLEPGLEGSLDVHGNPNLLTLDKDTSKLAQGSSALTALVEVERYKEPPPPIRVLSEPRFSPRTAPSGKGPIATAAPHA